MLACLVLYHALPQTGRIEWSTTSATGPWTTEELTAPTPMTAASFSIPGAGGSLFCDEGRVPTFDHFGTNYWVRAHPTFWELWGFSHLADINNVVHITTTVSGVDPQGIVSLRFQGVLVGASFPLEVESSEVSEYRAGRAATLHYGRVTEVEVSLIVPPEVWGAYQDSPLLMGHGAVYVLTRENDDAALSESDLGGAFTCYPVEALDVANEGPEDVVVVRLRATMEDRA